ncbi:glycerophosphodiester phosphodiesterase family protein [Deinococcus peraridilitoris]|uniref:Glycerophosphoryl diester phosphodiesterase n=1 Tax=Deinococcus peraridilitoris (strain DSM 19664 / LMG 22246 / CIP 109416 / KR-200) TaxID=937777 RepID=L0A037_DEIPD|nr:glycerophosphodiester phosphodiesterase family protein [Deinococcus peraridilitoris]AFZ67248.1 glycerophosphoryl diester phosphodiesterase [Deinococcus peraridilitoris DSM 19664]
MVKIIGHRGARGLWPENSLEGFRKLITLGVDGVEFDVHPTLDGALVVIHDATLDQTTFGCGAVNARTLEELQATRLRGSTEGIPSFEQVLEVFRDSPLELHIELKTDASGNPYPQLEASVIDTIKRHDMQHQAILTCFVPEVLERVRQIDPSLPVLASLEARSVEKLGGLEEATRRLDAIPGVYIAVEKSLLRLESVWFSTRFGDERLGVWVPNEEVEIEYWLSQPIRQITTDRPDLALQAPKQRA